jgi:hypothetical protein
MLDEVYRKGVLVCCNHVAVDFMYPGYTSK